MAQAWVPADHLEVEAVSASEVICIPLPLKIVSVANLREHWRTRAGRAKLHRATTAALLRSHKPPLLPITVVLTRVAARQLDSDNLSSAFKAVRDGVADWLKVNDNDPRVTWEYTQRKGAGTAMAEISVIGRMELAA